VYRHVSGNIESVPDPAAWGCVELGWGAAVAEARIAFTLLSKAGDGPGFGESACTEGQAERSLLIRGLDRW